MTTDISEKGLETLIVRSLANDTPYVAGDLALARIALAFDPAFHVLGRCGEEIRLPLTPASPKAREVIDAAMREVGLVS